MKLLRERWNCLKSENVSQKVKLPWPEVNLSQRILNWPKERKTVLMNEKLTRRKSNYFKESETAPKSETVPKKVKLPKEGETDPKKMKFTRWSNCPQRWIFPEEGETALKKMKLSRRKWNLPEEGETFQPPVTSMTTVFLEIWDIESGKIITGAIKPHFFEIPKVKLPPLKVKVLFHPDHPHYPAYTIVTIDIGKRRIPIV